jgi:hypothetical protein
MKAIIIITDKFAAIVSAIAALVIAFWSVPAIAADGILTDDTYASIPARNLNAGKSQTLKLDEGSVVHLKWDLSSLPFHMPYLPAQIDLPDSTTIVKATLRLYVRNVKNPGSFSVYTPAADWNEDTLTAANRPAIDEGVQCCIGVDADDQNDEIVIDLTDLVLGWVTEMIPNYGVILIADSSREERVVPRATSSPDKSSKGISITLPSKESPTYCFPARLEVTFGSNEQDN